MDSLTQLRKIAQGFPAQETGGDDIDEDEVPSKSCLFVCIIVITSTSLADLVGNFDEPSKSEV